jgi:hypothetical protein
VWYSGKRGLLPETREDVGDGWISDSILGVLASDMVGDRVRSLGSGWCHMCACGIAELNLKWRVRKHYTVHGIALLQQPARLGVHDTTVRVDQFRSLKPIVCGKDTVQCKARSTFSGLGWRAEAMEMEVGKHMTGAGAGVEILLSEPYAWPFTLDLP